MDILLEVRPILYNILVLYTMTFLSLLLVCKHNLEYDRNTSNWTINNKPSSLFCIKMNEYFQCKNVQIKYYN